MSNYQKNLLISQVFPTRFMSYLFLVFLFFHKLFGHFCFRYESPTYTKFVVHQFLKMIKDLTPLQIFQSVSFKKSLEVWNVEVYHIQI